MKKNNTAGWIALGAMITAGIAWFARSAFSFGTDQQTPDGTVPYWGVLSPASGGGYASNVVYGAPISAVNSVAVNNAVSSPALGKTMYGMTPAEFLASDVARTREAVARQEYTAAYAAVDAAAQNQEQRQLGYDIVSKVVQPSLTSVDTAGRQSQVEYIMNNPDVANLLQQSAMFAQNQVQQQAIEAGQLAAAPEQQQVVSQAAYDIARAMGIVL